MAADRRVIWCTVGVAGSLVAAGSARRARTHCVGPIETKVFRWFNTRSDRISVPVWMVMQSGSLGAVVLTAANLGHRRGARPATIVGIVGTMVWITAKMLKPLVGRGRPDQYLDDVIVRGARQTGLGYPSGHAAVSLALALMLSTAAAQRPEARGHRNRSAGRLLATAGVATTGAARMYVGAHLPLDIVGGYVLGAGAGLTGSALLRRSGDRTGR